MQLMARALRAPETRAWVPAIRMRRRDFLVPSTKDRKGWQACTLRTERGQPRFSEIAARRAVVEPSRAAYSNLNAPPQTPTAPERMIKVAIVGGSGYTALELIKILLRHPAVQIAAVTSRQEDTPLVAELHHSLAGRL